ncbi:hypothetical protein RIF29_21620 [Crotalaria pallida]|uniref:RRM domain-containing protein n=1 Tax=Crotalaria pallida TaxID=3830 RepID=A0AAN9F4W5_CROPI
MREKVSERWSGRVGGFYPSGFLKTLHNQAVSFFFTNFLEDFGAYKTWKVFSEVRSVGDVYLPGKRDKGGKRFGFVRFKDNSDLRRLEEKLNNMWIGDQKVWVNRARFDRDRPKFPPWRDCKDEQRPITHSREALQGAWRKPLVIKDVRAELPEKEKEYGPSRSFFEFSVPKEEMGRFRGCYVGKLLRPVDSASIQDIFFKEGFMSIKTTHLGGLFVLLQETDSEEIPELLFSEKKWFDDRFLDIRRWSPSFVVPERFTWVLCYGVPVHVWCEEFYRKLVSSVGSLALLDPPTAGKQRLDVGRILISTEQQNIDTCVVAKVNGKEYEVRLVEEPCRGLVSVRKLFGMDKGEEVESEAEASSADGRMYGTENCSVFGSESSSDESDVKVVSPRLMELVRQTNLLSSRSADSSSLRRVSGESGENVNLNSILRAASGFLSCSVELEPSCLVRDAACDKEVESFCPDSLEKLVCEVGQDGFQEERGLVDVGPLSEPPPSLKETSKGLASRASKSQLVAGKRIQDLKRGIPLHKKKVSFGPVENVEKKKAVRPQRTFDLSESSCNVVGVKGLNSSVQVGKRSSAQFLHSFHEKGETSGVKSVKLPRCSVSPKRKATSSSVYRGKKGKEKARSARGSRRSGSVDSAINNSISDSNIKSCCRLHYRYGEFVLQRLWKLGKEMGVSFSGKQNKVSNLIKQLEDMDCFVSEGQVDEGLGRGNVSQ